MLRRRRPPQRRRPSSTRGRLQTPSSGPGRQLVRRHRAAQRWPTPPPARGPQTLVTQAIMQRPCCIVRASWCPGALTKPRSSGSVL
eukprot:6893512-Prymnesium_polylepis.1